MHKTLIIFIIAHLCVSAQQWRKVPQKYYGMSYQVPTHWQVDGFGDADDWEFTGSAVCHCAGSINIGNRFEADEVYMVVYPTKHKDSLNAAKRLKVWQMVFDTTGIKSTLKTKTLSFEKTISKWTPETVQDFPDAEVWKLTTEHKGQYYVFYFWAKPEVLKKNAGIIQKILESFKVVH